MTRTQRYRVSRLPLEAVELFCFIADALTGKWRDAPKEKKISFTAVAGHFGIKVAGVSQRLSNLEELLGDQRQKVRLISRGKGIIGSLTEQGREFYPKAMQLLASHGHLADYFRNERIDERKRIRIGMTYTIASYLFPCVLTAWPSSKQDLSFEVHDAEYQELMALVESGEVSFAWGPAPSRAEQRRHTAITFLESKWSFGMAAVVSPEHKLAEKMKLELNELATQHLFVVPESVQPGLKRPLPVTEWSRGGRRTVLPHYTAVLSFVQIYRKTGVGIVPDLDVVLDDLRRQNKISVIRLPELGRLKLAVYLQKAGSHQIDPLTAQVVDAIMSGLEPLLATVRADALSHQRSEFPSEIAKYRYAYHVSCNGRAQPGWRRSKVFWTKHGRGEITGVIRDFDGDDAPLDFRFGGELGDKLLYLRGVTDGDHTNVGESFVETYHSHVRLAGTDPAESVFGDGAFLGTWTGWDDRREPASGPVILSTRTLSLEQTNELLVPFGGSVFLNAAGVSLHRFRNTRSLFENRANARF